jgi:hypothetical protein
MNFRKKIIDLVDKVGRDEASKILGLGMGELYVITKQPIDCETAGDIIYEAYEKRILVKKYKGFEIEINTFGGTLEWTSEVNHGYPGGTHRIFVKATPFWEGMCIVPVDLEIFAEGDDEYISELYHSYSTPESFENIEKLMIWFKEKYLVETYEAIQEMYEDNYKELIGQTTKKLNGG